MKIVLYCQYGMSTSLLINKMKEFGDENDIIDAYPIEEIQETMDKYDVALIGPQIRGKFEMANSIGKTINVPCVLIDMVSYGRMDGKTIYQQAKDVYNLKQK